jgi:hypothetical protein
MSTPAYPLSNGPNFDVNNQYQGKLFGQDRIGHTTPDLEVSDTLKPWLPCGYPAPYLPSLRQDQGHAKLANVVVSSQMALGQDKSSALVPAGLQCGATPAGSGEFCVFIYQPWDVGFTWNPQTGTYVKIAGEYVVLACPADAAPGNVYTDPTGRTVALTAGDITFAHSCNLFPNGTVTPIGLAQHNILQYLGGVQVKDPTLAGGILYTLNGVVPLGFAVMNYMHEMATSVQTQYEIRVPWIGATETTLTQLATADGVAGFVQGYGRSFTHYVGAPKIGDLVVAAPGASAGSYTSYNPAVHTLNQVVGRVHGVMNMIDKIGYSSRIKTLWDPSRMVGPTRDPNPASIMMGGSATGGIPYDINLTTDGIYKAAKTQQKPVHAEYGTYVLVRVNL